MKNIQFALDVKFLLEYNCKQSGREQRRTINMLEKEKMDRINELARKKRSAGLTSDEQTEQHALRQEYLARFRESFRTHLDNIEIVDGTGTGSVKPKN
jgi:uncharacterized protein YnzC (UPF0291/DUF896 family)